MFRLAAYKSQQDGGDFIGYLADATDYYASVPFNDVGSLTFSYPKQGRHASDLTAYFQVGLEIFNGTDFVEVVNGRFVYLAREDDLTAAAGSLKYELVGAAKLLQFALVWGQDALNDDGKREFSSASTGQIMKTLVDDNQALGWGSGLSYAFTTSNDSSGQPWASNLPRIEYVPTLDVLTVLGNLADQGMCDWDMNAWALRLWRPDTHSQDLSSLVIRQTELLEAPNKLDATNLRHKVLVQGEGAARLVADQVSGADAPWGKFFGGIQQGGINDPGLMQLFADKELQSAFTQTKQYTRKLALQKLTAVPLVDYQPGDYISAPNSAGELETLRVREIGVRLEGGHLSVVLTLNDRIVEESIRLARRTVGITGGATSVGGSGAIPGYDDKRVPKAPTGVAAAPAAYMDNEGLTRALAVITWNPVTQATDNTAFTVTRYQVFDRRGDGEGVDVWWMVTEVTDTQVSLPNYEPGRRREFAVKAVGFNGMISAQSTAAIVTAMPGDAIPPPKPSTPILTSQLGVMTIAWDGAGAVDPMPADFSYVKIHMGTVSGFTPNAGNAINTLQEAGEVVRGGIPYSTNRYFKFVAYDRSGNASVASDEAVGQVPPFLDSEALNGANLIPGTIDPNSAFAAGSIDTSRLRVGLGNLIADSTFQDPALRAYRQAQATGSWTLEGPSATYPEGRAYVQQNGTFKYLYFQLPGVTHNTTFQVTPGKQYYVAIMIWATGGTVSDGAGGLWVDYKKADGTTGVGGSASIGLGSSITSTPTLLSGLWTAPVGAVSAGLRMQVNGSGTAVIHVSRPYIQVRDAGVLIADGSITAGALAANSVTAGKLAAGSVTATAISAGAIDGQVITGATIRTSNTFPRWQANASGMRLYNSSGNVTADFDATTGNAAINGIFRTNQPGQYPCIELNQNIWAGGLMGLRFHGMPSHYRQADIYSAWADGTTGGFNGGSLILSSGQVNDTDNRSRNALVLQTIDGFWLGRITYNGYDNWGPFPLSNNSASDDFVANYAGEMWVSGSGFTTLRSKTKVNLFTQGDIEQISNRNFSWSNEFNVYVGPLGGSYTLDLQVSSGHLISLNRWTSLNDRPDTTSGSAIYLPVGSNVLSRMVSLSRYKLDQQAIDLDYRILDLQPKHWRDKFQVELDPHTTVRVPGFVAEDVQALSEENDDLFDMLLMYDEHQELIGLQYDRIPAFLIPVIRDMNERLTALEAPSEPMEA